MTNTLHFAVLQAAFGEEMAANIKTVTELVREAAGRGAKVVLPPELFQGPYFCKTQDEAWFSQAFPALEHPCVTALAPVSEALDIAIPVSIYEKDGPHYYNSLVMLDGGKPLGVYRKSHIPDGPGYMEKFYFRPGDTGFRVWDTRHGRIGVGICWDQWFPETARALTSLGAEILLYPTAIGSEPHDDSLDTAARWRRAMQGHAVSNVIPVGAANRIGNEDGQVFYGTSFICDHTGEVVSELGRDEVGVLDAKVDREFLTRHRAAWGFFRDRRTDLYGPFFGAQR